MLRKICTLLQFDSFVVDCHQVSENPSGYPPKGSNNSDSEEERWVSTRHIFKNFPTQPVNIGTQIKSTGLCDAGETTHTESKGVLEKKERMGEGENADFGENSYSNPQPPSDHGTVDNKGKAPIALDDQLKRTISHTLNQDQQRFVESVSAQCLCKLEGRSTENTISSVGDQVNRLLKEATDPSNLCRMYEGWTAWI